MSSTRNIVVVGGSYVGTKAVDFIAQNLHATHRAVLIEKNTHFQHLFMFPRYAVIPGYEHQAFIPFTRTYAHHPPGATSIVRGTATEVHPDRVVLANGESVPYEYLVLATGTKLTPPGTLRTEDKLSGIAYFQQHQQLVKRANNIVIIGGGAVGVQMATDIKDYYPAKSVTLVHSRAQLMNRFHPKLHEITQDRAKELGIALILEDRVKIPVEGFPIDGSEFDVELSSGRKVRADFVIIATGQTPLSGPLRTLSPSSIAPSGFISVKPTLQIADDAYPNVFAIGDVADTTNHKAARPGARHAQIVADNITAMVQGKTDPLQTYEKQPAGIHMTLGLTRDVKFRNPTDATGEPFYQLEDSDTPNVESLRMWRDKAPGLTDYFL